MFVNILPVIIFYICLISQHSNALNYASDSNLDSDPFGGDVFKDLNLNLNGELLKLTNSLSSKVAPSMVKQSSLGVKEQDPDPDHQSSAFNAKIDEIRKQNDYLFVFIVAGCILAGLVALIAASVCWYTVNRNTKAATGGNVEFGVKTPGMFPSALGSKDSIKSNTSKNSGDRKLAQSAQMYHYQHQKQQMIAMEKANTTENKADNSDNSDGEAEDGDYTVYECPGLAPTGEMEVKNPLFKEDYINSNANLAKSESVTSMPPSYSAINSDGGSLADQATINDKKENLVDLNTVTTKSETK